MEVVGRVLFGLGGGQLGIDGQIYPIGLKGGRGKAQFSL
jgi:hypothetical protein